MHWAVWDLQAQEQIIPAELSGRHDRLAAIWKAELLTRQLRRALRPDLVRQPGRDPEDDLHAPHSSARSRKPAAIPGAAGFLVSRADLGQLLVIEASPLGFRMDMATISSKTQPFQKASTL